MSTGPVEPTPPPTTGAYSTTPGGASGSDRSLGEIVGDISSGLSDLVRQEMELARTEIKQEVSTLGKGAGMLGGAGVAGYLALFFISLALMFMLDSWMHTGWAALIVAVLWGIVAAVLAVTGRKEIKEADPQLPKTQQTLKEDVAWAKAQKN